MENKGMVLKGISAYKTEMDKLEEVIKSDAETDITQYA